MSTANAAELRRLRGELLQRIAAHPASTWSPSLLALVVAAVDLQFGGTSGDGDAINGAGRTRPGLRVVRPDER
ncbi:hypothetical protein [Mycobacterium riyadhense]|uniref:Uncharacterized protein n=1 Tax=Mycobacterium riyadhense TaxID=486698 RepID=A0A1X2BJ25_9MYCO|nr:hypothetical protein [Mycobacterium riyadhense]MCV7148054.1 hypothetical protein [Mycobacterium riyadhense]ORW63541.1 hypothetical protein AWC22_00495 [Mycobacterium riyadhense]VTO96525.1 hypothetical protein BIN_B_01592 [Mycobacterium riyadhense]